MRVNHAPEAREEIVKLADQSLPPSPTVHSRELTPILDHGTPGAAHSRPVMTSLRDICNTQRRRPILTWNTSSPRVSQWISSAGSVLRDA